MSWFSLRDYWTPLNLLYNIDMENHQKPFKIKVEMYTNTLTWKLFGEVGLNFGRFLFYPNGFIHHYQNNCICKLILTLFRGGTITKAKMQHPSTTYTLHHLRYWKYSQHARFQVLHEGIFFSKQNCRNKDGSKLEVQIHSLTSRWITGTEILASSITKIGTSCKFGDVSC